MSDSGSLPAPTTPAMTSQDAVVIPEPITGPPTSISMRRMIPFVALMVVVADLTLYRTEGYFGPAVFLPTACMIFAGSQSGVHRKVRLLLPAIMILLLSSRLAWSGSAAQVAVGLWLLNAFIMMLHGLSPFVPESFVFMASAIPGGYEVLQSVQRRCRRAVPDPAEHGHVPALLNTVLPVISVVVFSTIFVFANPDLISGISAVLGDIANSVWTWLLSFSFGEILFWSLTAWLTAGLIVPRKAAASGADATDTADVSTPFPDDPKSGGMYVPYRNTLLSLIGLYGVYLCFEFLTLWFRTFPAGFHYSGYAHQGAAWLTAALALATVILSLMFRGRMIRHPMIGSLRRVAWIWSLLNFLLAASVYNRLLIYIDYNGMTRMRVVGMLGITAVVCGFILVIWKILKSRSFHWLVRRQLLVPCIAVFLYVTLPVDSLVHRHNVRRILDGHPESCVQISEHPIEDAALPVLIPLLKSDNAQIRDGVSSLLDTRLSRLQAQRKAAATSHWTARQFGVEQATTALAEVFTGQRQRRTPDELDLARRRFREYAMQWW